MKTFGDPLITLLKVEDQPAKKEKAAVRRVEICLTSSSEEDDDDIQEVEVEESKEILAQEQVIDDDDNDSSIKGISAAGDHSPLPVEQQDRPKKKWINLEVGPNAEGSSDQSDSDESLTDHVLDVGRVKSTHL